MSHSIPGASARRIAVCASALFGAALALGAQAPRDGWVTATDGIRLHYLELGQGSSVILLHGYGADAEAKWFATGVAQELARSHRVFALDCRGHGKSDQPHDPGAYGPHLAEDVIALMDGLGIERAHVHGYSMGGGIVTQLLDRHRDRLITASYGGAGVSEIDPAWVAKLPPDRDQTNAAEEAERARRTASESGKQDEAALRALMATWEPAQFDRIDLTRVKVPVLAIEGALDQPNQKLTRMKRELETFWSYVLPDRGHLTTVGQVYTNILKSFLDLYDPGTPPPEHAWFTAHDGVKLHYWKVGPGGSEAGHPVVLLHGFTGSADMWLMNGMAAALRGRHLVLALDCRGHGRSDKPHDPMKYGLQIADDVVELLDHERVERAHIHGFSLGGWILAQLLVRHPERILTAGFVGHAVLETDPELVKSVPRDYPDVDTLDPKAREAVRAPIELEARRVKGPGERDDEALKAAREYPWPAGSMGEGEIFPSKLPIDLTQVKIPVLAIMGSLDFPNLKTHRMWRQLDDLQIVRLPGRAHTSGVSPGYASPAYVPATVRFIDGNDAPVATSSAVPSSAAAAGRNRSSTTEGKRGAQQ